MTSPPSNPGTPPKCSGAEIGTHQTLAPKAGDQPRELHPAASSFTPVNARPASSMGGVALPAEQSRYWRPTDSNIQQRALNGGASLPTSIAGVQIPPSVYASTNVVTTVNNALFPRTPSWRALTPSTFNPQGAHRPLATQQHAASIKSRKARRNASEGPQNPPLGRLGDLTLADLAKGATPPRATPTRRNEVPHKPGPPTPKPTLDYLRRAGAAPAALAEPQSLLVIIDLNGTMLDRGKGRTGFVARPGAREFLEWLMYDDDDDNSSNDGVNANANSSGGGGAGGLKRRVQHRVMVWSSATPQNVGKMVAQLFTPAQRAKLVAVWARDTLGLTAKQYAQRVQVFKELRKVWADAGAQASFAARNVRVRGGAVEHVDGDEEGDDDDGDGQFKAAWDQSNTVLIDDSWKKASSEPFNLVEIDEFENRPDQRDDAELQRVRAYISEAANYVDVSSYMKRNPFRNESAWPAKKGR